MADELLTAGELALWNAWKHASDAVMNGVSRELVRRAEISGPEFGILSRLVDLGNGELRQQDLADSLKWDKSRLSHQLSRMAERALLERRREEANVVHVRITRKGRAKLEVARVVHARAVRTCLLDAIPADARRGVLTLLVALSPPPTAT